MARTPTHTTNLTPVQMLVGGFLGLIVIGTLILMIPDCHAEGSKITFLDALFTSTSAVCVTGLIVVDTAVAWSRLGQTIILILLQLGGIGIVTFGVFFALLLGQKVGFYQRALLKEQYGQAAVSNLLHLIPVIALGTILIELTGAVLLYPSFRLHFPAGEAAYHSVFHAVSAFCNAGFSTFSNSLEDYQGNFGVNAIVALLIVLGGFGFPVLAEFVQRKKSRRRMSFHARVVLVSSGILIVAGAVLFYITEMSLSGSFRDLPQVNRIFTSIFQSITCRTAGFNTVNIGTVAPCTLVMMMVLMFIGGSPSGTAGGIKTTTLVVSLATLRAVLRGKADAELFDRCILPNTSRQAIVLVVIGVITVITGLFLMLLLGDGEFGDVLFEVVSAFGTVGLSTGITPQLSAGQQIVIMVLMFVGRLGPMTFALALASPRTDRVRMPEAQLVTG